MRAIDIVIYNERFVNELNCSHRRARALYDARCRVNTYRTTSLINCICIKCDLLTLMMGILIKGVALTLIFNVTTPLTINAALTLIGNVNANTFNQMRSINVNASPFIQMQSINVNASPFNQIRSINVNDALTIPTHPHGDGRPARCTGLMACTVAMRKAKKEPPEGGSVYRNGVVSIRRPSPERPARRAWP
jgi:hypothetical protein